MLLAIRQPVLELVTVKDHELPTIICPTDLADVPTNNGGMLRNRCCPRNTHHR
ncbi:MAG: hypothetical protein MZV63_56010 [Marinilabiliales bacterium]|nr:hypothetical protein [Marinilabiliales bacterium]